MGLTAIEKFFDILKSHFVGFTTFYASLGLTIVFVILQILMIYLYVKLFTFLINLKPKLEILIRRILLMFD